MPMGGVLGGVVAFGSATEFQSTNDPHIHGEVHIVCIYQFSTLEEIANEIKKKLLDPKTVFDFNAWLHREEPFDPTRLVTFFIIINVYTSLVTLFFVMFNAFELINIITSIIKYLSLDHHDAYSQFKESIRAAGCRVAYLGSWVRWISEYCIHIHIYIYIWKNEKASHPRDPPRRSFPRFTPATQPTDPPPHSYLSLSLSI